MRRAKQKAQRQSTEQAAIEAAEGEGRRATLASLAATAAASTVGGAVEPAEAMSNGAVSDAWSAVSGAPSDLTFPDEFLGTWLCYSTLTAVATPQGEDLVQDMPVVRARRGTWEPDRIPDAVRSEQSRSGGHGPRVQRGKDGGGDREGV